MKRLNDSNADVKVISNLIKKLEIQIIDEKITEVELEKIQKKLDTIDELIEEPDYRLYELQSIIYYARNDKKRSLQFIGDALELENNATLYSKTGALLAEIYCEKNGSHDDDSKSEVSESSLKHSRYNSKLEGWLALYTLRVIFAPIILFFSSISFFGDFSDPDIEGIVALYFIICGLSNLLLSISYVLLAIKFFKKRLQTIEWAGFIEILNACLTVIVSVWLFIIYQKYGLADDGTLVKDFVSIIISILWASYWFKSKRVKATFTKK